MPPGDAPIAAGRGLCLRVKRGAQNRSPLFRNLTPFAWGTANLRGLVGAATETVTDGRSCRAS